MSQNLRPLSMIYNQKSGFHASQQDEQYEGLMTLWTQYGFEIQVFELSPNSNFDEMMSDVLSRHQNAHERGVVVAAGGDGTLNAVAKKLMHTDIPLGIIPLGTIYLCCSRVKCSTRYCASWGGDCDRAETRYSCGKNQ